MSLADGGLVLGYHGCDEALGIRAIRGQKTLISSDRDYDWLGPGVYFWEGDPVRALEWAQAKARRDRKTRPFVIGAVIRLGNCLDLTLRQNLELLAVAYHSLSSSAATAGKSLPVNKDLKGSGSADKLMRYLDCAVIRRLHAIIENRSGAPSVADAPAPFDTIRGLFPEGPEVYDGGGFQSLTHTQIAVRNDSCIRGFFLPRSGR